MSNDNVAAKLSETQERLRAARDAQETYREIVARVRELADCDGWEPMRAELLAVLDGECAYGHCYCGGCVL